MSNLITRKMVDLYIQMASPTLFLSGFFVAPPQNFHTTEEIEIDIVRSEEDVAIVVQDLSVGYRNNSTELYTNKSFKPPIFKESVAVNSFDLLKRVPGQNPFESPDFRANVISRMFQSINKIEAKIRRSVELQASQVLQTGIVTLTDSAGVALYTLDYKPKATHFPTVGTTWNLVATDDKIGDIRSVADIIRGDGLVDVDELIFGDTAWDYWIQDARVQNALDNRRIIVGEIAPEQRGNGQIFQGYIWIGNYRFSMWTYQGRYKHPQTGVSTKYIDAGKVIVRASSGRMDATFGAIPNIGKLMGQQSTQLLPELPGRISNGAGSMDFFTNAWLTNDGEQLFAGIGARPLMIPTAIDTFGCVDTGL